MQGWIKLHRELFDKPIWNNTTSDQKAILITLLLLANHKPTKWLWRGNVYSCEIGQFVTSLNTIQQSGNKGISIQTIRTALILFEKLEFLTNKSTKAGRLITILNYKTYQFTDGESNKDSNKDSTKQQQSSNKAATNSLTPNNNINNVNNVNNVNTNTNCETDIFLQQFDQARVLYPGTKRGLVTEYNNFKTRYKDYKQLLALLKPAIEKQIRWRSSLPVGKFVPEWKNFTTWINNRCWEEEVNMFSVEQKKSAAELAFDRIVSERNGNG
jgi:hypothetical protein